MQVSVAPQSFNYQAAPTSAAGNTYAEEQRGRRYQTVGKLALGAADMYVAGATAFAGAGTMGEIMPFMSGAAAAYHGIKGLAGVFTSPPDYGNWGFKTPQQYAVGTGNLIMAAGFASLAFGLGPWALPIIGIGQAAVLAGDHFGQPK